MYDPYICTIPGTLLTASRCPNTIFDFFEILINIYLDILGGKQYLTMDSIPGQPGQPPDHLQIASKKQNIVLNI